jgi:hypothetical protein
MVCRYEQGLREGRFSAEEMRRRAARESLERYTHYYERYHAHDVSRKEATRLLAESVSDQLRRVSGTTQIAESQLKFIIEVCFCGVENGRVKHERRLQTPCVGSSVSSNSFLPVLELAAEVFFNKSLEQQPAIGI